MKKLLTGFFMIGSIGLFMMSSCKKNDAVVTDKGSTSSTLSSTSTTLVLDKTKINDTTAAITFSVSAPQYSFSAVASNSLQIDVQGDNWKNPTTVSLGTKASAVGYSTATFDALMLKLNLPAGTASQVNIRVVNALSTQVKTYSNVISVMVTPFNLSSWLYITGNFAGWANPGPLEDSLESVNGNGVYTGIIDFVTPNAPGDDEFLVLPVKGSWNHKYATNDAKNTTSKTIAYDGPNNFYAPGEGYYMITFDINKNLITFQAVDYYSVTGNEVVGGDWGVDQFMKYINDGTNTWKATLNMAPVSGGGFKIRYDAQWTYSWGPASICFCWKWSN